MYTDVFVVGEFDDLPTPTFTRRTPAPVEPTTAPIVELLPADPVDTLPATCIDPVAPTDHTTANTDPLPHIAADPIPPTEAIGQPASISYPDIVNALPPVHTLATRPCSITPAIYAVQKLRRPRIGGAKINYASNLKVIYPDLSTRDLSPCYWLPPVACFRLIPPVICLFPSAQDSSFTHKNHHPPLFACLSGRSGKRTPLPIRASPRLDHPSRLSPNGTSLIEPDNLLSGGLLSGDLARNLPTRHRLYSAPRTKQQALPLDQARDHPLLQPDHQRGQEYNTRYTTTSSTGSASMTSQPTSPNGHQSGRFARLAERDINKETFVTPWPEAGLAVANSPYDPAPSLKIENGLVVEMDGKPASEFDALDAFICAHALDLAVAAEAMSTPSLTIARMLVDINVSGAAVRRLVGGCTPAKLVDIIRHLSVLEMMMGLAKMRVRRTPANQAHVTNWAENPALLAADAAEATLRGFAEIETTVRVARAAPLNALSILVGAQTGRGGVLTQCAVEESLGLRLAMKGLTTYAETLSVYGTEHAFTDGDDTPWSKSFLNAAYASRGVKVRFTSGTGSEALMGHAEQRSMLYLEARCLLITRGAGSQGVQNGSISCIALPEALPGGVATVLAENLLASMLGLECASGNDALASHSAIRKTAKLMLQFIPGTDFIFSGYSAVPKRDNMFGGGNFDADDLDDYNVLQRDMQIDGGLRPISEEEAVTIRRRGAQAIQAVYAACGMPPITDSEVEAATYAHNSDDMPPRALVPDLQAADAFLASQNTLFTVVKAVRDAGFEDVARNLLEMARQRVAGDYLQPSAIFDRDFNVQSGINDPNDYAGPGSGYRLDGDRWQEVQAIPQAKSPHDFVQDRKGDALKRLVELSQAKVGTGVEVVVAVGPAFGTGLVKTIEGLDHNEVLEAILSGIAKEDMLARLVKVYHTADCGAIGHVAATLSGSGIGIGIQSRGTTIIQKKGLPRLSNLELFPQSPSLTLAHYEQIGRNAALYAKGLAPVPVAVKVDNTARLRRIVKTALLHRHEIEHINAAQPPVELHFDWEPAF